MAESRMPLATLELRVNKSETSLITLKKRVVLREFHWPRVRPFEINSAIGLLRFFPVENATRNGNDARDSCIRGIADMHEEKEKMREIMFR